MASKGKGPSDCHFTSKISLWQKRADDHREKQLINPFSEWDGALRRQVFDKNHPDYGRPLEGSLTDIRGKQASMDIKTEISELCHLIKSLGTPEPDGTHSMSFGQLFQIYTVVSNNLVGVLLRARRQGLVRFEGEMLYQRRDDDVVITCISVPA